MLSGTDEEFATLESDIVFRLPQLTTQCYEEHRTTLMGLPPEGLQTREILFSLKPPSAIVRVVPERRYMTLITRAAWVPI